MSEDLQEEEFDSNDKFEEEKIEKFDLKKYQEAFDQGTLYQQVASPQSSSILDPRFTKKILKVGLMSVKAEILLFNFRQAIYWQSLLEFSMMFAALLLNFVNGLKLAQVWLHVLHFVRPAIGYRLLDALPKSHELLEMLPNNLNEITESHQTLFLNELQKTKRPFALYFIVTIFCVIFDLVGLFLDLSRVGGSNENWTVIYTVMTWIFLCFDTYFFLVIPSLQFMLPGDPVTNFLNLGKGYVQEARNIFGEAYEYYILRKVQQNQQQHLHGSQQLQAPQAQNVPEPQNLDMQEQKLGDAKQYLTHEQPNIKFADVNA